jgi:hypothetical protein
LIVDPEEVVPSGNYGSDGLTDRLRGQYSSAGLSRSAREVSFEFDRSKVHDCAYDSTAATLIEPEGRRLRAAPSPHCFLPKTLTATIRRPCSMCCGDAMPPI